MSKNTIIKGTFILTATGLLTRLIGFFFRMFLSHTFGEEQVGLYQLIFPIYTLCFSLSSAGIETALSRCIAQKLSCGKKAEADTILYQALLISLSISLLLSFLLRKNATFLSIYILGDLRCDSLLSTLSFALPFVSLHCCIHGYYLGQKQTTIPAISQFMEQVTRVGAVYLIYQISLNNAAHSSIQIAVVGLIIGECTSALFCLRSFCQIPHIRFSIFHLWKMRSLGKELIKLATPLTFTRALTTILQSIENISIPLRLQSYGFSNSEALSTYGVLTGMALPCILFPTALTNSVSTMLLPTVAEIQATDNIKQLRLLVRRVILFGFVFGSVCGIGFLLLGSIIGNILFNSSLSGNFIQTLAWICPFLYMNTTLISILNGLGRTSSTFIVNVCSLFIRIGGVWCAIPSFGMQGYLWGLLSSQLLVSILCITLLRRYVNTKKACCK